MVSTKRALLSSTVMPFVVLAGVAVGGVVLVGATRSAPALAQCAAKKIAMKKMSPSTQRAVNTAHFAPCVCITRDFPSR